MTPLYRRILKDDYNRLPQAVQDLHDLTDHKVYSGMCDVVRGKSMLNRILASILGFPVGGAKQKLHISFEAKGEKEHWRRCFGGAPLYQRTMGKEWTSL